MNRIISTLVLVYDDEKILLGMKKRGFGEGKWNGFGGKVEKNELPEEAAIRELCEETLVEIHDDHELRKRGVMNFTFDKDPDEMTHEVHVFSIESTMIIGNPEETEEMLPKWFLHPEIPFEDMWVDDIHWMPLLLEGENFSGEFHFSSDGDAVLKKDLKVV